MRGDARRGLSLWLDALGGSLEPRAPLEGEREADVAVVGAGYTGLWTAYYLKRRRPAVEVAVVEAEIAGFGASGRNGGWCLGLFPGLEHWRGDPERRARVLALQRAMFDAVDEVGRVAEAEGIDCRYAKGGTLRVATSPGQRARLRRELEARRAFGLGEEDFCWLEPDACAERLRVADNLGAVYSPHCAALDPARLARGLADAVERLGVAVYERSPARALRAGAVETPRGRLRARVVVRATEGYTPRLPGLRRALLPIHSMMIATEPLAETVWKEIGLARRETFGDARRIVIYGQRTADDRLAFGGRAAYYFGSGIRDRFAAGDRRFEQIRRTLEALLPPVAGAAITHRWGGPLGVPRDRCASVGIDREAGLAWGGGYTGEGVATSNLAGRTLADLILERDTERVRLPWVGHRSPAWEPEPLRWLGVTAFRRWAEAADRRELGGG